MNDKERQLLKSAQNGCVTAFEQLIEPFRIRVFNMMLKSCENRFEASQLAQEVFIRIFSAIMQGNLKDNFAVCIYKTADEISRQNVCKSKMIS